MVGKATQHEADLAPFQRFCNVGNSLSKESVVPEICGRKRAGSKKNHHRLAQYIGRFDRSIERGIIDSPLRALHPVNHAGAVGIGNPISPHGDARIVFQCEECVHFSRW